MQNNENLSTELITELNSFTESFLSDSDNTLDKKTIELIATAVSICVNCGPCTDFHINEAKKQGATSEEINKVFKIVMAVSAGKNKVFSRSLRSKI